MHSRPPADLPGQTHEPIPAHGMRFRLLLVLNVTMSVLVSLFLIYDYNGDFRDRLQQKRIALSEQARLVLLGFTGLNDQGQAVVDQYVRDVLKEMQATHTTEHIVGVSGFQRIVVAGPDHYSKETMERGLAATTQNSPSVAVEFGEQEFLVGRFERQGWTAYVAEDLHVIRNTVHYDLLRHLTSVLFLAVAGGVIINFVLTRVVVRPLERLASTVRKIGSGSLGLHASGFTTRELAELARTLNLMSDSLLKNEQERVRQMAKARRIQEHLLPTQNSECGFQIAASFRPADEISGDYYDVIPAPDGSWFICIADVSGHGVAAALNATMLKVLLMEACKQLETPSEILAYVDERMVEVSLPEMFATMFIVRLVPATGELRYACGGHESGWLVNSAGNCRELPSTGPLVGAGIGTPWENGTELMAPGDRLVLVTDGVTEATSEAGTLLGREKLRQILVEQHAPNLDQFVDSIEQTLSEHRGSRPPADDSTILLVELTSTTSTSSHHSAPDTANSRH